MFPRLVENRKLTCCLTVLFLVAAAAVSSYAAQTERISRLAQQLGNQEKRIVIAEVSSPAIALKEVVAPPATGEAPSVFAAQLGTKQPVKTETMLLFPSTLQPEAATPVFDYEVQREEKSLQSLDWFLGSLTDAQWKALKTATLSSTQLSSGQIEALRKSFGSPPNITPNVLLEFDFRTWMVASRKSSTGIALEVNSTAPPKQPGTLP